MKLSPARYHHAQAPGRSACDALQTRLTGGAIPTLADLEGAALGALQAAGIPFEALEPGAGFRRHPRRDHAHLWVIANSGTGQSGRPWLQVSAGDPKEAGGVDKATFTWCSWKDHPGAALSPGELAQAQVQIEAQAQAATARLRQARELARDQAAREWDAARPSGADAHPYLVRKGVAALEVRVAGTWLLVPVRDAAGNLHALQRIGPDGAKRFTTGGEVTGHFHLIAAPTPDSPLYLAEGYATGATVHQATGAPVAVCFNCGNLLAVARSLRNAYPRAALIVVGDNDAWTPGNPGATHAQAAAAAVDAALVLPQFRDTTAHPTDFNDLAQAEGIEAVRAQLETATRSGPSLSAGPGTAPWPDLVPLGSPDLPGLPATTLPGWAGAFADALARATETPTELALGLILAAAAVPCARRLRLLVAPGHFEPTNLWLAVALPPGNRKSAVQSAACAPLVEWERAACAAAVEDIARAAADAKTLQARANAARADAARAKDPNEITAATQAAATLEAEIQEPPKPPQLWTSDATPERLGAMLADQDECMAWLSSEAGLFDLLAGRYSNGIPNLDLVLKAWSGDPERVDRGSRPPVYLLSPRLTIGLSPQPEVLRGLSMQPGFRGRGLLARFNYLLPPSPLGHRNLGADRPGARVPPGVEAAYAGGIRAMLEWPADLDDEGNERPHLLRLEPAAYDEWLAYARAVEVRMLPGGDLEGLTDLGGKAPGQAARIAAVLHGIEHAHRCPWDVPVSLNTMGRALDVAAVMLVHSIAAMDAMGADPSIAAARRVWDWIERGRRSDTTVREAYQSLKGTFPRVAALNAALDALAERGYVRVHEVAVSRPGRPPSPVIEVRPDIVEGWR